MSRQRKPWGPGVVVFTLLAASLLATSCSTNPATGERQVALIGEAQEVAMGKEADQQVVQSLGLYDNAELQQYVDRLGQQLARESERPDLPWTFRVVDDASVNAFAIPGGFIYMTRGIMTHLNSEAELATILGHEIAHVTGAPQREPDEQAAAGADRPGRRHGALPASGAAGGPRADGAGPDVPVVQPMTSRSPTSLACAT
jgi:predicted Zn-dependent protease